MVTEVLNRLAVALGVLLCLIACSENSNTQSSTKSVRYGVANVDNYVNNDNYVNKRGYTEEEKRGYTEEEKRGYTEEEKRGYTEEEIGISDIVDDYINDDHILVHYRTYEARSEADLAKIESEWEPGSPLARDRILFENRARWVLRMADEERPLEVETAVNTLQKAFYQSLDICTERSQWPEIKFYNESSNSYIPITHDEFIDFQNQYKLTPDEFLDFRHECHKYAAPYPVLDPANRDELIKIRQEYYREFLREWMLDYPETVVPIDYENSINHPYVDYLRLICLEEEDPEECARSEGITLE
ncbi:MAG: hypothetical protein OXD37_07095 [Acidimicrobiaceae bacterium]|nr:hypothetical protein [Acidimicrobiaceae bacterium]